MSPLLLLVLLAPASASADSACSTEELAEPLPNNLEHSEPHSDQFVSLFQGRIKKKFAAQMHGQASFNATAPSEADNAIDKIQVESDVIQVKSDDIPEVAKPYLGLQNCTFKDEKGQTLEGCGAVEFAEHQLVSKWIRPDMTVLELGGRYGTTTCAIAAQQDNSGLLLTVEPDNTTWGALEDNLRSHQCNCSVLKGVVGTVSRSVHEDGYTTEAVASPSGVRAIPLRELEQSIGMRFNAMMIDCEGCIEDFLSENPDALSNVDTIILEADQGTYDGDTAHECFREGAKCVDYDALLAGLSAQGFEISEHVRGWNSVDKEYDGHQFALQRKK